MFLLTSFEINFNLVFAILYQTQSYHPIILDSDQTILFIYAVRTEPLLGQSIQ